MQESDHTLRHLPFFEFVASRSEDDPQWRSATAGLLVLRLVDAWADDGPAAIASDAWAVSNVRAAIEAVDPGTPIRSLLDRIVDAIEQSPANLRRALPPLMAYGQALEYDAQWQLAADVYHTVLGHLDPLSDSDSAIAAHLGVSRAYRLLAQLHEAGAALDAAMDIATTSGDMVGFLRARIGLARLDLTRGNLPRAQEILDDTIRRAEGPALMDVKSRALHDRSNVAHQRGQYELAIQLAYHALRQSQSPREHDRILGDIALSFLELGVYSAAQDAYLVLSATAQEQYVRWAATLNLLEISALTGAETLFELYRRQLATETLPPLMQAAYHVNVGQAYRRFNDRAKAKRHLDRGRSIAGEFGFNRYVIEAEQALDEMTMPMTPARVPTSMSLDTQEVASALRQLRELAGAT